MGVLLNSLFKNEHYTQEDIVTAIKESNYNTDVALAVLRSKKGFFSFFLFNNSTDSQVSPYKSNNQASTLSQLLSNESQHREGNLKLI